jgi:hypothetical protein
MSPLPFAPPLQPDRDEALRMMAAELAKPDYANTQTWLDSAVGKLLEWLTHGPDGTAGLEGNTLGAIVAALVVLAAVAVFAIVGPLRRERRAPEGGAVFADDSRSAAEIRREAEALAARGDWTAASIQRFRALVRALGERVVIEESPGLTAAEAMGRAGLRLPTLAAGLRRAGNNFDWLAYGGRAGSAAGYRELAELDELAGKTTPAPLSAPEFEGQEVG